MNSITSSEASKPNPKLAPLQPFIGTWSTTGTHPMVPGKTFHGRTTFAWIEGGAFLVMRSRIDEPEIPSGIAIFGTDDGNGTMSMLYFDERGVSRRYEVEMRGNVLSWSRNASDLSQRMSATIAADGRSIDSRGEMSRNGGPWQDDLQLKYTRLD